MLYTTDNTTRTPTIALLPPVIPKKESIQSMASYSMSISSSESVTTQPTAGRDHPITQHRHSSHSHSSDTTGTSTSTSSTDASNDGAKSLLGESILTAASGCTTGTSTSVPTVEEGRNTGTTTVIHPTHTIDSSHGATTIRPQASIQKKTKMMNTTTTTILRDHVQRDKSPRSTHSEIEPQKIYHDLHNMKNGRPHEDNHKDDDDDDDDIDIDEYSAWNDLPMEIENRRHGKSRNRHVHDDHAHYRHEEDDPTHNGTGTPWIVELWNLFLTVLQQIVTQVRSIQQRHVQRYRHSQQNRFDLHSLQQQHQKKCQQMKQLLSLYEPETNHVDGTKPGHHDNDHDDTYDFVLILQPQAVYGFWSEILDFRPEMLGPPIVQYMEEQWRYQMLYHHQPQSEHHDDEHDDDDDNDSMVPILGHHGTSPHHSVTDTSPHSHTYRSSSTDSSSSSPSTTSHDNDDSELHDIFLNEDDDDHKENEVKNLTIQNKIQSPQHTSSATIRRRLPNTTTGTTTPQSLSTTPSSLVPKQHQFQNYRTPTHPYHPTNSLNFSSHRQQHRCGLQSPGLYSYLDKSLLSAAMTNTAATTTTSTMMPHHFSKKSLFERAIESPPLMASSTMTPAVLTNNHDQTPLTFRSQLSSSLQAGTTTTPIPFDHRTGSMLGNNMTLTPASMMSASHIGKLTSSMRPTTTVTTAPPSTTSNYPRRFGNPNIPSTATAGGTTLFSNHHLKRMMNPMTMMSPPVRSLLTLSTIMGPSSDAWKPAAAHPPTTNDTDATKGTHARATTTESVKKSDPNVIDIHKIHNPVIAHGIATRTSRTNGMSPFLQALRDGIVVRRHRPGQEAMFCQFTSLDGGDTITLKTLTKEEAIIGFRQQRERLAPLYDNNNQMSNEPQYWSVANDDADDVENMVPHNFSIPNSVATNLHHKQTQKNDSNTVAPKTSSNWATVVMNKIVQTATQRVGTVRQRAIHTSNVVSIHPGQNVDPWLKNHRSHEVGTGTIRRSQSDCNPSLSFSVILLSRQLSTSLHTAKKDKEFASTEEKIAEVRKDSMKIEEYKEQWHRGIGSESNYRYLDFEAASECEYWFIIRGLLFLHRDALVGRYAKHRAAGIGTNNSRMLEQQYAGKIPADEQHISMNQLHVDEFHEPHTVGWLERTIVDCRKLDKTYMEGFVAKKDAIPPPSDYFLGFRSPGTSIWSRLRQAGLETQRLYSLDPNRVMIKVRCPIDRLLDVAEVLRINVKTKDGSFTPFREEMIDDYDSMIDPLEDTPATMLSWFYHNHYYNFQFRSSIRQTIIDFIIGSRIRDSGAELGQTTDLGQKVQARVPLHMPNKLNAIFASWFYFWKVENWSEGRTGRSLTHADPIYTNNSECANPAALQPVKQKKDDDDDRTTNGNVPNIATRILVGSMYQPLDSIEAYFGEKVAFYFTWLQHTASHLVFLSIAGLILFLCQLGSGTIDHPLRPLFSIVVMIWTFIVLINWKKRANYMAHRWGTMNYKEQETTRPQFKGDYVTDEITGEWIVTYPKWKRWLKYCISFPLTLLFTLGTLVLILWVHANRDLQLAKHFSTDSTNGHTKIAFEEFALSSIGRRGPIQSVELSKDNLRSPQFWFLAILLPSMLGLFLPLLNFLLMRLSILLNDFENYRTESEYRTYLIIKVFSFRFVCYFATLYYYSIISIGDDTSTELGQQSIDNGILRVATGVLVYTTVAQWWQNFVHVCFPMLIGQLRMNHRNQRLADELRELEVEEAEIYRLSKICFDEPLKQRQIRLMNKRLLIDQAQDKIWIELLLPTHDSFPEYIQAVVQFIFVSCFSVVLPLTPLIVLFNYLVSMRLDAYKLCRCRRRPIAEKTGGIGVWEHVLHVVAVISVLTNCWLMGFTSSQFYWIKEQITEVGLFAVIVVWEHIMLLIKYVMTTSISSLPKTVRDAMKREQYELNKQRNTLMQERRQQQQQMLNEEMMNHDNIIPACPDGTNSSHRQLSSRLLKHRRSSRHTGSIGSDKSRVSSSSSVTTTTSNNRSILQQPHVTFQHHLQQQHQQRDSTSSATPESVMNLTSHNSAPAPISTTSYHSSSTSTSPESSYLMYPNLSEA